MSRKFVTLKLRKIIRRINIGDIARVYSRMIRKLPKLPKYNDSDTEISCSDLKFAIKNDSKVVLSSSL